MRADHAPAHSAVATEAATRAGTTANQTVAGAPAFRGAGELPGAVLLAEIRATVLGPPTSRAFGHTQRVAAGAAGAGRGTAIAVGGACAVVTRAHGEGGCGGKLDIAHASPGAKRRAEKKPKLVKTVGHRSGRTKCAR